MTGTGHDHRRGAIPFWAHQLVELLLALVLLVEGARSGAGVEVLGAAVVLLLFALATDGPLGAWRGLSRRAHRVGDFVLAALLVVGPLAFGVTDPFTIALLLVAAASLGWLGWRGDFTASARRAPWRRSTPEPSAASGPASGPASPAPGPSNPPARVPTARPNSRDVGRALARLRVAAPRIAGRTVGRTVGRAAAKSTPAAETATPAPDGDPDDRPA